MSAFYGTLQGAQDYFTERLHSGLWDTVGLDDREKALKTATRRIDRLAYVGEKNAAAVQRLNADIPKNPTESEIILINQAGETQELEFPRGTDTVVPTEIENANYELAFAFLDGRDADEELEDLATISQGYSSVRRTRDRSFVHEHLNAGIPSSLAWQFLKPYLRDDATFRINRV